METEREIAIEILEEFEDLLEGKNITIPSEDREGNEEEARIYGFEYYNLEDNITGVIKKNHPKIVDENLVRGIIRTYQEIMNKKFNYGVSNDDEGFAEDLAIKELCDKELEEIKND